MREFEERIAMTDASQRRQDTYLAAKTLAFQVAALMGLLWGLGGFVLVCIEVARG